MPMVGYARVSSSGQDLAVQLEKLEGASCEKVFKEKRSGVDDGRLSSSGVLSTGRYR